MPRQAIGERAMPNARLAVGPRAPPPPSCAPRAQPTSAAEPDVGTMRSPN